MDTKLLKESVRLIESFYHSATNEKIKSIWLPASPDNRIRNNLSVSIYSVVYVQRRMNVLSMAKENNWTSFAKSWKEPNAKSMLQSHDE